MTRTWRILVATLGIILLATSAWAQEKPRLGFKDIYLGMPKVAIQHILEEGCREQATAAQRTEPEVMARYVSWCLASSPLILQLPRRYELVGSISLLSAKVLVKDEKVGGIHLELRRHDYDGMQAALEEKYGRPTNRTVEVVKNKLGAEFNSEVLTWELKEGTVLMKERSSSLDISEVLITSYAFLDKAEKERKSRAKKDAEGL